MAQGTLGLNPNRADLILRALLRPTSGGAAYQGSASGIFIQLHGGSLDPSPTGMVGATANARVAAGTGAIGSHWTMGTGAALGTATNAQQITFQNVAGSGLQTYTYWTGWNHVSSTATVGGIATNLEFSGSFAGTAIGGQDFLIDIGGLIIDLNVDD